MNVAIVGCGVMGKLHAQCASDSGLNVTVCVDSVPAKAESLAKIFNADAADDASSVCARPDVDIVAVLTPTPSHSALVMEAAKQGKHVFCEKPFCRTLDDCSLAATAAKQAGIKLFVGHVVRYFHEFEAIRGHVLDGKVGKPGFVRTYRGGICPTGESNWYRDYELSGGVTLDCIIHDFDWIRYVFGDPERIFCQNLGDRLNIGIDYSLVTLRMKSGVIVNVTGTWAQPSGFHTKVEICGDGGMVQFDSDETPIQSMLRDSGDGKPSVLVPASPVAQSPYLLEWLDFAAWLRGESEPRVTVDDAVWAVRMGLGALESARTGQPVSFA